MSANPKSLAKDSACWCLKGTAQRGAKLYLLNKWANASPAPACIPPAAPVLSMTAFVIVGAGYLNPAWTEAADPVLDFLFAYGTTLGGPYPNTVSFGASARNGIVPGVVAGTPYYGVIYARTSVSCVSPASNEANVVPVPPPIDSFSYTPPTDPVNWTDMNGSHSGDLATFKSSANIATVVSIDFSSAASITAVSGLQSLPHLHTFSCVDFGLTSLDVSELSELTTLDIGLNSITSLDCSGLSNLSYLTCTYSGMTSLVITGCTALSYLDCSHNSLTALNVSGLSVLDTLDCSINLITSIVGLSDCHIISSVSCQSNLMDPAHVSSVLCDVDASGANTGDLDISHNSAPTAAGLICSASLDPTKGWSVTHD